MFLKRAISQPPRKPITFFSNSITYWRTGKRLFQKSFHNGAIEEMDYIGLIDDLFGILRNPSSSGLARSLACAA
ncbi:hypothetical protein Bca52824_036683 [Brassica carinata]|uniref:Uncharacterized protein n=1 Tax=Brassica carinata TaxID=52824 RepID=A0A8X7V410_BRACI|nr:hypothetical protein Bca52824_036683 [Brassica carinata]